MPGPLGNIYSLEEAATHLRLSKRKMAKIAKTNGLCSVHGRDILFSEEDIRAIWGLLRASPSLLAQKKAAARPISESRAYENLLAHAKKRAEERSSRRRK
ncbi:hypothetical protein ACFFP0_00690 [Rhizobium puerariae]|uniref:Helix-turn-helix domain-containing protein n=1 Tax=Rhizobium puerariae TaxID=1585791 RepID=A0ABV6ACD7_9HYPH